MKMPVLAAALLTALFAAAFAKGGELTCAQLTRLNEDAKRPPTDENDVRMRAYCKKHPKEKASVAFEKTFRS